MVISIFGSAVPSHLITFPLWSNSAGHVTYKLNTCALHICSDMGRENREGGQIMHYGKMLMRREKEGRNEGGREDATLNSCPSVTVSLNAVYVQDNTLLRKLNVCTRYEFGLHCIFFQLNLDRVRRHCVKERGSCNSSGCRNLRHVRAIDPSLPRETHSKTSKLDGRVGEIKFLKLHSYL